jgi:hypothetical protein
VISDGPIVLAAVERVGSSGRYILGQEVEQFERALAEFCGVSHAVGIGNGMDALEIALRCLDLETGGKVLTNPWLRNDDEKMKKLREAVEFARQFFSDSISEKYLGAFFGALEMNQAGGGHRRP